MNLYTVLYLEPGFPSDEPPLAFECQADDAEHAEEQCIDAYPECTVVWTQFGDAASAFAAYLDQEADL